MSKRQFTDDDIEDIEELDPMDVIKEKKVKKKTITNDEEKGFVFDEVLDFKDNQEKFIKTMQIGSNEGIGLTNDNITFFRFTKKENKIEISKYQFNMRNTVIPYLLQALLEMQKINNKNKKI
jgi:hypothetical protein